MAEIKITCPCCLSDKQCFEEKVEVENFSSYICFNCGFMSNSYYTEENLGKVETGTTKLVNELKEGEQLSLDELSHRTGLSITETMSHLTLLELNRYIKKYPSGKYEMI